MRHRDFFVGDKVTYFNHTGIIEAWGFTDHEGYFVQIALYGGSTGSIRVLNKKISNIKFAD